METLNRASASGPEALALREGSFPEVEAVGEDPGRIYRDASR